MIHDKLSIVMSLSSSLLKTLYKMSSSAVRVNGELTDWFPKIVGVRQGCVSSPQLFNIILEMVILHATYYTPIGTNIQGHLINNIRFADDIVLLARNEIDLQSIADCVHAPVKLEIWPQNQYCQYRGPGHQQPAGRH